MSRKLPFAGRPAGPTVVADGVVIDGVALRPTPLPGPIRGVLFDMCNVLYDNTVWRRWVLRLLSHVGLHTSYHSFFRIWDRDFLVDVHRGQREFRDAFEAFLFAAGLSRPQIEELLAACLTRRRELQGTLRPLPGVKSTLTRLHQSGLSLAVLADSEHPAERLSEQLQRVSLDRLLCSIVSSIDLGRTMPDPACYLTSLRAMNLPAEQVAFVGHDTAQLAGAADVGMRTIAFNYDADARADVHVARFEELVEVIGTPVRVAAAG